MNLQSLCGIINHAKPPRICSGITEEGMGELHLPIITHARFLWVQGPIALRNGRRSMPGRGVSVKSREKLEISWDMVAYDSLIRGPLRCRG